MYFSNFKYADNENVWISVSGFRKKRDSVYAHYVIPTRSIHPRACTIINFHPCAPLTHEMIDLPTIAPPRWVPWENESRTKSNHMCREV